jgi:Tfp pilus assembly protein PilO
LTLNLKQLDRICLATVVAVSLFFGFFVANAGIREKGRIRHQNEQLDKGLKDLSAAEMHLKRIKGILDASRRRMEHLNRQVPESAEIGEFLNRLDLFMARRSLSLISVQPLPSIRENLFVRIPVQILFKGSFADCYGLLQDLETMNRVVVVNRMNIGRNDKARECRIDLTASIYERWRGGPSG